MPGCHAYCSDGVTLMLPPYTCPIICAYGEVLVGSVCQGQITCENGETNYPWNCPKTGGGGGPIGWCSTTITNVEIASWEEDGKICKKYEKWLYEFGGNACSGKGEHIIGYEEQCWSK